MPIRALAKEYGRLMDLYYDNPSHKNWWKKIKTPEFVTRSRGEHEDNLNLVKGMEKIWLEHPDDRVAFETKLRLGVK